MHQAVQMSSPIPRLSLIAALAVGCGPARDAAVPPSDAAPTAVASDPSLVAEVESLMALDVDPCVDFYAYACGGWLAQAEIPPDRPLTSRPLEHIELVMQEVREIVEGADFAGPLGQHHAACLDRAAQDADAPRALAELSAIVGSTEGAEGLARAVARVQATGSMAPWMTYADGDVERDGSWALYLLPGRSALPLPGAYEPDASDADGRARLEALHRLVETTLRAYGEPRAGRLAKEVVEIERRLEAAAQTEGAEGPTPWTLERLTAEGSRFDWTAWGKELGVGERLFLRQAEAVRGQAAVLADASASARRAYLQWTLARERAETLGSELATAHFDFFGRRLQGRTAPPPLEDHCAEVVLTAFPEEVDRLWLERRFDETDRAEAEALVVRLQDQLREELQEVAWLDEPTRQEALTKAAAVGHKVGFSAEPKAVEHPPGGDGLAVDQLRIDQAARRRELAQVGQAVDPEAWIVPAISVGAYYHPTANEVIAPAGILQPPYFQRQWPAAMRYGAIGTVLGHELTHGFDTNGRAYDARGRNRNWWTEQTERELLARAECVEQHMSGYEATPGVPLVGERVLAESIADLGGISLAYEAFAQQSSPSLDAPFGEHLSHRQLFFVAFAQQSCSKATPEHLGLQAARSPHAPAPARVNAAVANSPEFWDAFACEPGRPMHPEDACEVW